MSLPRETRLARQTRDTGAPDDNVLVGIGTTVECYHDDPGCHNIDDTTADTLSRREAQLRWKGPCLACVIDGGSE